MAKWKCKLCGKIVEYRSEHLIKEHPELGIERYFFIGVVRHFDIFPE